MKSLITVFLFMLPLLLGCSSSSSEEIYKPLGDGILAGQWAIDGEFDGATDITASFGSITNGYPYIVQVRYYKIIGSERKEINALCPCEVVEQNTLYILNTDQEPPNSYVMRMLSFSKGRANIEMEIDGKVHRTTAHKEKD